MLKPKNSKKESERKISHRDFNHPKAQPNISNNILTSSIAYLKELKKNHLVLVIKDKLEEEGSKKMES
jgi:hypothetical protein